MTITIHSSLETSEYFFSSDHCQKLSIQYNSFIPISYGIPQTVAPREGLKDGIIKSVGDLIFIYYRNYREINNPEKKYQRFEGQLRTGTLKGVNYKQ